MSKKKTESIEPCGIDLHLKYLCNKCHNEMWLSLHEVRIEGFICVCDTCHKKFKTRTIGKITINYLNDFQKQRMSKQKEAGNTAPEKNILQPNIKSRAVNSLVKFGFTKDEAGIMVMEAFEKKLSNDVSILVKTSLKSCGEQNV